MWERFVSQGQKGSVTGISRAHLESFKLDLKGDVAVAGVAPVGQHSSIYEDWEASHPPMINLTYDLVAITETWWNSSHDWNRAMDGSVRLRIRQASKARRWSCSL